MKHIFFILLFICIHASSAHCKTDNNNLQISQSEYGKTYQAHIDSCYKYEYISLSKTKEEALIAARLAQENYRLHDYIKALNFLSKSYYFLGNTDSALHYIKIADKWSRRVSDSAAIARVNFYEGVIRQQIMDNYRSLELIFKAYEISLRHNVPILTIDCLTYLALLSDKDSDYNKQLDHISEALDMCHSNGIDSLLSDLHCRQCYYYAVQKKFDLALECYNKALDVAVELDNQLFIQTTMRYKIVMLMEQQKFTEAITVHKELFESLERYPNYQLAGDMYTMLGHCYSLMGDRSNELKYNLKSLETRRKLGIKVYINSSLINTGKTYLLLGEFSKALEYGHMGLSKFIQLDNIFFMDRSYTLLYKVHKARGQIDSALYYLELHDNLQNEMNKRNIDHKIANMKYQHLKQFSDMEARAAENRTILFIVILILLFGVIFFLTVLYLNKRSSNRTLSEKNRIISQSTAQIKEQNDELSALNETLSNNLTTRDRMFSIIAHDLTSPLLWLRKLTEILATNYNNMEPTRIYKSVQAIFTSSDTISNLVENLLQWGRTQTGNIRFHPEVLHLKPLGHKVMQPLELISKEKKIDLNINIEDKAIVYADEKMLECILRNLVINALKFTQSGGKITVSARTVPDKIIISVADTGVGIQDLNISQITKPQTGTDNEKGTGLGLLLCKNFLEKHGSCLEYDSKIGKGTIFYFALNSNIL